MRLQSTTIFIDANTWTKGVQTEDHKMKILNRSDDTTIFLLRDITTLEYNQLKNHMK